MKAKRIRFPHIVKRGSSVVKIYRDRKPTGTYYRVAYHIGGKRHRLHFNDLEKATSEAEAKAAQLSRGDVDAMQLSGRDRLEYGRAKDAVKQLGVSLDAVAIEYSDARKLLDGVPLLDAARFYARHHGRGIKRKPVADAVDAMMAAKTAKGVSDVYLADLRYRLGTFAQAFHCDVSALAPDDVARFFDGLSPFSAQPQQFRANAADVLSVCAKTRLVVERSRIFWNAWKGAARNERPLKSSLL